ncbi:hypothetical protein ID866_12005 [Astraeus odoratus]|nr:hypothetical protein ID866_12005 [Astraeus odoratus]
MLLSIKPSPILSPLWNPVPARKGSLTAPRSPRSPQPIWRYSGFPYRFTPLLTSGVPPSFFHRPFRFLGS